MLVVLPAPLTPTTMITVGLASPTTSALLQRRQQVGDGLGQQPLDGRRVGGLGLLHAALQVGQQELGGRTPVSAISSADSSSSYSASSIACR
jgi:hypothetical protein